MTSGDPFVASPVLYYVPVHCGGERVLAMTACSRGRRRNMDRAAIVTFCLRLAIGGQNICLRAVELGLSHL
jgi:hypothetical protein